MVYRRQYSETPGKEIRCLHWDKVPSISDTKLVVVKRWPRKCKMGPKKRIHWRFKARETDAGPFVLKITSSELGIPLPDMSQGRAPLDQPKSSHGCKALMKLLREVESREHGVLLRPWTTLQLSMCQSQTSMYGVCQASFYVCAWYSAAACSNLGDLTKQHHLSATLFTHK